MAAKKNILVLHGPNLNLLGEREPRVYGRTTLAELNARLRREARGLGLNLRIQQRNGEGGLLDLLHENRRWAAGVLINPGAYTHYSYALRDGLAGIGLPCVEVHLSDIRKREAFRRLSVTKPACAAVRMGKGVESYVEGLRFLARLLKAPAP